MCLKGIGRCGGGRYGGGHYGGGRYGGTLQKRVDGTAESHDTHITMDATAERCGGSIVTDPTTMCLMLLSLSQCW